MVKNVHLKRFRKTVYANIVLIWQFEPFLNLLTSYNVGNDGNLTNPVKSRLCEHNQPQAGGHTKLLRY